MENDCDTIMEIQIRICHVNGCLCVTDANERKAVKETLTKRNLTGRGRHRLRAPSWGKRLREHSGAGMLNTKCLPCDKDGVSLTHQADGFQ